VRCGSDELLGIARRFARSSAAAARANVKSGPFPPSTRARNASTLSEVTRVNLPRSRIKVQAAALSMRAFEGSRW
jgi:hypothetical protein